MILARKQQDHVGGSAVTTSGNLLKQLMSIKHDLDSLNASLSSVSTASASRRDMKEKLQVLMNKKAEIEAKIARRKAAGGDQRKPGFLHGFLSMEKRRQKLQQSFLQPTKRNCTRDLTNRSDQLLHPDGLSTGKSGAGGAAGGGGEGSGLVVSLASRALLAHQGRTGGGGGGGGSSSSQVSDGFSRSVSASPGPGSVVGSSTGQSFTQPVRQIDRQAGRCVSF